MKIDNVLIEKINNDLDQLISILGCRFELQGEIIVTQDEVEVLINQFEDITKFRDKVFLNNIKGVSRIGNDDVIKDEIFLSEMNKIKEKYISLEEVLVKNYRLDHVSEPIISGDDVLKICSYRFNGFLFDEKSDLGKDYYVKSLMESANEYAYELFYHKKFGRDSNMDTLTEVKLLSDKIDDILHVMISTPKGRDKIYHNSMMDIMEKKNELSEKRPYTLNLSGGGLYRWQKEAYEKWINEDYRSIFEVGTGAGKTIFALYALQEYAHKYNDLKAVIVVPTEALQEKWLEDLKVMFGLKKNDIGRCGGGYNSKNKPITIYIAATASMDVNSKNWINKRLAHDLQGEGKITLNDKSRYDAMLIADEVHNLYSNRRTSTYLQVDSVFKEFESYGYNVSYSTIGLTATLNDKIEKDDHISGALGPHSYSYTFVDALKDKIISKIKIVDVHYELSSIKPDKDDQLSEIEQYEKLKKYKRILTLKLAGVLEDNGFDQIESIDGFVFMFYKHFKYMFDKKANKADSYHLTKFAMSLESNKDELFPLIRNYIGNKEKMKKLRFKTGDRLNKVYSLIDRHKENKIIIFCEYIEDVRKLTLKLDNKYKSKRILSYDSKLSTKERTESLKRITASDFDMLVVATAIDEGVDVPTVDIGIIYQGKHTKRQDIQRLGRIIRKAEGKEFATLYNLMNKEYNETRYLEHFFEKTFAGEYETLINENKIMDGSLKYYHV